MSATRSLTPPRSSPSRSFVQLCSTKHPFRRTVPLRLTSVKHRPPSNTSYTMEVTFADDATQRSFAEFSRALHPLQCPPAASPAQLRSTSGCIYSGFSTQCRFRWCDPPNSGSQSSFLGASTLVTRWIDSLLCLSHGNLGGAPLHHPKHMDATLSFSSASGGDVRTPVPRTQLNGAPPPLPGLEVQSPLRSLPTVSLSKQPPVRPRSQLALAFTSSGASFTSTSSAVLAATDWSHPSGNTHSARSSAAHKKECKYRPEREPTLPLVQTDVLDVALSRSLGL